MKPERRLQPIFSKDKVFSSLAVALPIFAAAVWHNGQPSRWPGPDRVVSGRAVEVALGKGLRGWRLTAPDRRFGGLSALAVERGALLALTDSGVVARFAPPIAGAPLRIALHDLPDGPGHPLRKSSRDSESLLPDPAGRGWWVAFENRHSLWLFDRGFRRVLAQRRLKVDWPVNRGGEALAWGGAGPMVLPENGGPAVGGAFSRASRDGGCDAAGRRSAGLARPPHSLRGVSILRSGSVPGRASRRDESRSISARSIIWRESPPRRCPEAGPGCGSSATTISGHGCGRCSSRWTCRQGADAHMATARAPGGARAGTIIRAGAP